MRSIDQGASIRPNLAAPIAVIGGLRWGPRAAIVICASSFVTLVFYLAVARGIEPFNTVIGIMLFGIAVAMVIKLPLVLVGGLLIIGMLKSKFAEGVSLTDPTFIMLTLVTASILLRLLFTIARLEKPSLSQLLAGQAGGLATYLLFLCIVGSSYLYGPSSHYGLDKILRLWTIDLVLFASPIFLLKDDADMRRLMNTIVVLALIVAALTLLAVFSVIDFGTAMETRGEARTRIGEGWLIGSSIFILLYYALRNRHYRRIQIFCISFLAIALVASLARGPLVSLLIVLALCLVILRPKSGLASSRKVVVLGIVVTVLVSGMALLWIQKVPTASRTFSLKESEMSALADSRDPGGTIGMRLSYYKSALNGFIEKPILGWGVGAWPLYYWREDARKYPHNIVLETAFEEGMLGLIALFAFLAAVFSKLLNFLRTANGQFAFLFPVMVYSLSVTMFSGDINSNDLWFWSGVVFAAARINVLRSARDENERVDLAYRQKTSAIAPTFESAH